MSLQWQKGRVSKILQVTPNTRLFFLEIQDTGAFDFVPGQFITMDLPIHEKPARRLRSFSIASAPDGTNELELVIVLFEGGAGSSYLFNEVEIGSELSFRGPLGIFTLPEKLDRDIFLICTGTGIAPYRSMLRYILNNNIKLNYPVYLIFGTRSKADLLYYEEMKQFEKQIDNFHYIPTLSREKWEGETGYVHPIYEKLAAGKQPAHFYLCGWRDMIKEAAQRIKAMGYDRKCIHQELFG